MRITVMTVGSRGDVQPLLALARGLQAAGHTVRFATHEVFEGFVRENGLDFAVMPANPFIGMNAGVGTAEQQATGAGAGEQPFKERFAWSLEQWMAGGLEASRDAEAIVFSQLCFVGHDVAEKLGVPSFRVNFGPLTPTRAFPTIYQRLPLRLGGTYNWLTHIMERQLFWQGARRVINRARAKILELPPLPFWGPYGRMERERHPVLYPYSAHVIPKPPDWGDWVHVTGFWFLEGPADWQPPVELAQFLESGPPPVFLGLGSIGNSGPVRVTKALLSALARAGQRTVVMPGKVDLSDAELPKETCIIGPTSYEWLFPRMAAVICHGGPGTISYALRAGVPTLAVPFFGEQFFWSRRVAEIGAGAAPVPYNRMTVERGLEAIRALTGDGEMRRRAAALGQAIQAEDGVARAVAAVSTHLSAGRRPAGLSVEVRA